MGDKIPESDITAIMRGNKDKELGINDGNFTRVVPLKEQRKTDRELDKALKSAEELRKAKKLRLEGRTSPDSVAQNLKGGKRRKKRGGHHLFKRLGVSRKATKRQIKKAYEKKKKKGKLSKRVKYAYRILSNPKSRKKYINSYKKTKKHRRKNQRGCSRKKR
tara:strand:- start:305 stop:790 length:486 start_codon:yes stop_codon:yes gene_type:complete